VRATIGLLLLAACWSAGLPRPPDRPLAVAMTSFTLGNGIRVVAVPDPRATEVQVVMRYRVGSSDDPAGREGMAHLAEHLSFQHLLDGHSLHAELARITTSFDGYAQADATTFVARGAPAQLARMLAVETARAVEPCADIDAAAVARERANVVSELRQRGPALVALGLLYRGMFAGHPYARFVESEGSLGAITAADACAFASAGYATDDAVLVVSGAVTADDVARGARATLGTLPRRSRPAVAIPPAPERLTTVQDAALDAPIVAYGWPLPPDPGQRARVRAVASILVDHLTDELHGDVTSLELGGERAPILVVAIVLSPDETVATLRAACEHIIAALPDSLGKTPYYDESFDHVHQLVLARFVANLQDGNGVELRLADHVLAARDPRGAIATELHAVETLDRSTAIALARSALAFERASTVVLEPDRAQRRGEPLRLDVARHAQPPAPDDPRDADHAAAPLGLRSPLEGAITRTLPSGIRLVLLPLSSVPSVDVRFVYAAGTGDEGPGEPGVARLAAIGLHAHPLDVPELVRFFEAGGALAPTIGRDHTSFRAAGLERHLDITLSGVARWLDGGYYKGLAQTAARIRSADREDPRDAAADAAWRAALFGRDHPYAREPDLARLDEDAVQSFRARSYTPNRLTIIIAGGFDPAVASAWVEHATGALAASPPHARPRDPVKPAPVALGITDDTALLRMRIALPVAGDRASALVLAAMVDDAVAGIRFERAASYGLTARLEETRLASWIEIDGYVDAARAREAMGLIRERLAGLRAAGSTTQGRFVRARYVVMKRLVLVPTSARAVADRAEDAAAMGRSVADELATAEAVRTLTLAALAPRLALLDLAGAVVQLRGPRSGILGASAAAGRTPQLFERT
jgi:zinc protease